jgi:hypothetical protein
MGIWLGLLEKWQCFQNNIRSYKDYKNTCYSYNNITVPNNDKDTEPNTKTNKQEIFSRFLMQYQVPIYAFLFIFGTTGNIILLLIIIFNKDMRTVPNMYILNLAVSDIIHLTVLFWQICVRLEGNFMCTFRPFCRRFSVCLSVYSVAVISIQRYRVTVNPFHVLVSSQSTWRVTVATICGVWILAAFLAVPSGLSTDLCEKSAALVDITYLQSVVIFGLLVSCVIPFCVIAFTYIMTARHLVESSRSISQRTQNSQLKTRRNTAKIVVGLTVVFLISYVPYNVLWTYIIWTQDNETLFLALKTKIFRSNYVMRLIISTCLLLINSCLNPVALFCTSSPFRRHLKRYLNCFCKTSTPSTDIDLKRIN